MPEDDGMSSIAPDASAHAGKLELSIVACHASFEIAGRHQVTAPVTQPLATIGGSHGDADYRLVGPDSVGVSGRHVLVRATHAGWTARDDDSLNGTWEWVPDETGDGRWWEVPRRLTIPVHDGLTLSLGPNLRLRMTVVRPSPPTRTTPKLGPPTGGDPARLRPPELERLALELLEPRRQTPPNLSPPMLSRLLDELDIEKSTLYKRMGQIRRLPRVEPHVVDHPNAMLRTADAVARAFPYLLDRD